MRVLLLFVIGVFFIFAGFMCHLSSAVSHASPADDEWHMGLVKMRGAPMTEGNRILIINVCGASYVTNGNRNMGCRRNGPVYQSQNKPKISKIHQRGVLWWRFGDPKQDKNINSVFLPADVV